MRLLDTVKAQVHVLADGEVLKRTKNMVRMAMMERMEWKV